MYFITRAYFACLLFFSPAGTTAVISQYLTQVSASCSAAFTLGTGKLLTNWPKTFVGVPDANTMCNKISNNAGYFGYADARE